MIKVFHNKDFLLRMGFEWGKQFFPAPEALKLVAEVDTDNLDEAYRLTNHIDDVWDKNEEVLVVQHSRSTSCGDILLDQNGCAWIVAAVGFERIPSLDHVDSWWKF
jgi:hypothetical protein